jgi:hypothetical protein
MARTQTTAQANANAAPRRKEFTRVFVQNPDGGMTDVSAYLVSADPDASIDQPIAGMTIRFRRDMGPTLSLSPLRTDSTLNRNAALAYAPLLDVARAVYVEVALLDPSVATTPAAGDWQRIFQGTFDVVDPAGGGEEVICTARDLGARLQDTTLEQPTAVVVAGGATLSMEAAIQQVLDTAFGAGVIPLYTPTSPSYTVTRFGYQREPVYDAILRLVQSIGWDCRFLWDSGTSSYRLTLYNPPRTKTVPDHTLGPSRYISLRRLSISRASVRNRVKVFYTSPTFARGDITVNDTASQARYGMRPIVIEEAGDSVIDTPAEATTMANALLADLKDPKADGECEMPFFWPVELGDLIRFSTNGVHFNSNQDLAVVGIRHSLVTAPGQISKTTLTLRGSPAGGYRAWMARAGVGIGTGQTIQPPWVSVSPFDQSRGNENVTLNGGAASNAPATPFQWRQRETVNGVVGAWSGYSSAVLPQLITIQRDPYYQKYTEFEVLQADGQSTPVVWPTLSKIGFLTGHSTGHAIGQVTIDDGRAGAGGMPTPRGRLATDPIYDATGATPLIDPVTRRIQLGLLMPGGTSPDVTERGGNKGDTALDSGNSILASYVDFSRSFLNKHLGYVPDDATSDRRSATANEKTGGSRGFTAIDSGGVAIAAALDFTRSYTGKHFGNVPDDATSDRRAATANEKTGGGRGFIGFDSSSIVVAGSVDFARSYTGKHFGNVPDDATSDRRAATANEKTGGSRGFSAIDSGGVAVAAAVDLSRGYTNKHMGYIPDDATSDRRAVTLVQKNAATRADAALDGSNKLQTGVTTGATAADGVAGIESGKGAKTKAARGAGHAGAQVTTDNTRGGTGGLPTPGARVHSEPIYDATGATPLIDPVRREILSGLGIGTGVRSASDFAVKNAAGALAFGTNRHNDEKVATNGVTKTFDFDFDHAPQIRAIPQSFLLPGTNSTVDRKIEFAAIDITVSSFKARSVLTTGSSSAAQTDDFSASQNTTPGSAGGVALQAPGAVAYCQLASATAISTNYTGYYDVNTVDMDPANTVYVDFYRNDSAGSTTWTLIGGASYGSGINTTGIPFPFTAALGANWDIRMVISYAFTPSPTFTRATITADRVDYDAVTGGTEVSLTPAGTGVLYQAMEAP